MPKPPALVGDIVGIRYVVNNVDEAIDFYTKMLEFNVEMHPAREFAILSKGNLRLLLTEPMKSRGGTQEMPDGTMQAPGGWNRFEFEVKDLEPTVKKLKKAGCKFRNEIITGTGGNKQILLQDPSGNLIELIQY